MLLMGPISAVTSLLFMSKEEMREGFLEETSEPKPEGKWREGTVNKEGRVLQRENSVRKV